MFKKGSGIMNQKSLIFTFLLLVTITVCGQGRLYNSFRPGELWVDDNGVHINAHGGSILFYEGRYYWFGEHKIGGRAGNVAHVGVHCYSSIDLYNWKDEGIALQVVTNDPNHEIAKGRVIERPKVIYNEKTKKFVMWFHLEPYDRETPEGHKKNVQDGARSAVAVSDCVTGPYKYLYSLHPNTGYWPLNVQDFHKTRDFPKERRKYSQTDPREHTDSINILGRDMVRGQQARDMTLFVDDNGKAYHIYSSEENSTLHIAELTDDYTRHSGKYKRLFVNRYMEAPAMFKKDGKYYLMMSGCTGWKPNEARSAVADSIFGEWKELGNPCVGEDSVTTFHSQSTYILPIYGKKNQFIYMGDRWKANNAIDGRYIWLPIEFEGERFVIKWKDEWSLKDFWQNEPNAKEPEWDNTKKSKWNKAFLKVEIPSSADGKMQKAYFHKSAKAGQPLIVCLHTWSANYEQHDPMAKEILSRDWNYVHPDFRGANNHPEAMGSPLVISDIEDAIRYALQNTEANPKEVHIIGASGGGYATLISYMNIAYPVKSFSAWVPISDIEAWYWESVGRKQKYAKDILKALDTDSLSMQQKAHDRSPLYQTFPKKQRQDARLYIYTGVHDGYLGSVPITHSIRMYNRLVSEMKYGTTVPEKIAKKALKDKDLVSDAEIIELLTKRCKSKYDTSTMLLGRSLYLVREFGNIRLSVFEGAHEQLPHALELLPISIK